ncbi:MAG: helix-turn-helix domain-containing protein [Bacteroidota bacterium]|nr:helix-turn-helix domain-containing protein [Bacteroidota bacterium]
MNYTKIKTKKQYKEYMTRFSKVFQAKTGTRDGDEAELLALIIKDYEDRVFPIEVPDPIEAIKYRMEQEGLSKKDLAKILGYKSRVSDIFSGRRKLTLDMVRNLHEKLNIPLASLVK